MGDVVRFADDGSWARWCESECVAGGGADAPVVIDRDDEIVGVDCPDWPARLRSVQASELLAAFFDEIVEEGYFDMSLEEEADPICAGNDVDGISWG